MSLEMSRRKNTYKNQLIEIHKICFRKKNLIQHKKVQLRSQIKKKLTASPCKIKFNINTFDSLKFCKKLTFLKKSQKDQNFLK